MPDFIDDVRISESVRISKVAYVAAWLQTSFDGDSATTYRQVSECRLYLRGMTPSFFIRALSSFIFDDLTSSRAEVCPQKVM